MHYVKHHWRADRWLDRYTCSCDVSVLVRRGTDECEVQRRLDLEHEAEAHSQAFIARIRAAVGK